MPQAMQANQGKLTYVGVKRKIGSGGLPAVSHQNRLLKGLLGARHIPLDHVEHMGRQNTHHFPGIEILKHVFPVVRITPLAGVASAAAAANEDNAQQRTSNDQGFHSLPPIYWIGTTAEIHPIKGDWAGRLLSYPIREETSSCKIWIKSNLVSR